MLCYGPFSVACCAIFLTCPPYRALNPITHYPLQDAITSILVHPAPKTHLLTTGSADKTLRTWDARTGTLIREHKGHQGPVLGAALGKQGSVVVSGGDDGVCLVFETE